jgi:hypothetical protein
MTRRATSKAASIERSRLKPVAVSVYVGIDVCKA